MCSWLRKKRLRTRKRIREIEKTLRSIVVAQVAQVNLAGKRTQELMKNNARFLALESIVEELAVREGVSASQLSKHIEERARVYLDQILRTASDTEPNMAGQIDDRPLDDIPESDSFPPLFP
jgi:hypothetical protein